MGPLVTTEVVIGVLLLALLLTVCFVWVRRRRISRGGPLVLGAISEQAGPRWRLGLLRLSDGTLDWFSVVGPSFAPEHRWARGELDLDLEAGELAVPVPGLSDPVRVRAFSADDDGTEWFLAMNRDGYYAVRAWLEASPPGHRSHHA